MPGPWHVGVKVDREGEYTLAAFKHTEQPYFRGLRCGELVVKPFHYELVPETQPISTPTLSGKDEVRGFLQAALNAAWLLGLRPKGRAGSVCIHPKRSNKVRFVERGFERWPANPTKARRKTKPKTHAA